MGLLTPGFDKISKVTIVPRSNAGGFTLFVPPEEDMYTKKYLESRIQVALGGRVAEEIAFGIENTTTGASADFQSVASLARTMVTQWGFSEVLGQTAWEVPNTYTKVAEGTQELIDIEVQEIVEKAYKTCKQTLTTNWGLVKKLVDLLLVEETVNADTLMQLVS
jgi:cell division protease FtsH